MKYALFIVLHLTAGGDVASKTSLGPMPFGDCLMMMTTMVMQPQIPGKPQAYGCVLAEDSK